MSTNTPLMTKCSHNLRQGSSVLPGLCSFVRLSVCQYMYKLRVRVGSSWKAVTSIRLYGDDKLPIYRVLTKLHTKLTLILNVAVTHQTGHHPYFCSRHRWQSMCTNNAGKIICQTCHAVTIQARHTEQKKSTINIQCVPKNPNHF